MRSKEDADKAAEALLEAERRKSARDRVTGNWPATIAVVAAPAVLMFSFALFLRHPLTVKYVLALDAALLVPPALVVFHIRREFARIIREQRAS